jgi:hypothetical protein
MSYFRSKRSARAQLGIDAAVISSGVYTPTWTIVANLDAITGFQCQYIRVGDVVTVGGQVSIDPTSAAVVCRAWATLPIASNLASTADCMGVIASASFGEAGAILGDTTNDASELFLLAVSAANHTCGFSFTYRVI